VLAFRPASKPLFIDPSRLQPAAQAFLSGSFRSLFSSGENRKIITCFSYYGGKVANLSNLLSRLLKKSPKQIPHGLKGHEE
jgi:hypothetical protein